MIHIQSLTPSLLLSYASVGYLLLLYSAPREPGILVTSATTKTFAATRMTLRMKTYSVKHSIMVFWETRFAPSVSMARMNRVRMIENVAFPTFASRILAFRLAPVMAKSALSTWPRRLPLPTPRANPTLTAVAIYSVLPTLIAALVVLAAKRAHVKVVAVSLKVVLLAMLA